MSFKAQPTDHNYTQSMHCLAFSQSWGESFERLTDEEAGRLIKAVFQYTNKGEWNPPDGLSREYQHFIGVLNCRARKYLNAAADSLEAQANEADARRANKNPQKGAS